MAKNPRRYMMPDIDSPDWRNPGKQHDFDEFYVASKDENDEHKRIYSTLPLILYKWMQTILDSRKFPFQREGDLIRYAIHLTCCQLSNIEQDVPDLREIIEASNRIALQRELESSVMSVLDRSVGILNNFRKHEGWNQIVDYLAAQRQNAEKMSRDKDGEFWGRRWAEELQSRFGDLEFLAKAKVPPVRYIDLRPSQAHDGETGEA